MLIFNRLSFHHFVQEVNEIQCLNNSSSWILNLIDSLYQMVELQAIQGKHLIKIILWESVPLQN